MDWQSWMRISIIRKIKRLDKTNTFWDRVTEFFSDDPGLGTALMLPAIIIDKNLIKCDKNSKQSSNQASTTWVRTSRLVDLSQVFSNVIIKEWEYGAIIRIRLRVSDLDVFLFPGQNRSEDLILETSTGVTFNFICFIDWSGNLSPIIGLILTLILWHFHLVRHSFDSSGGDRAERGEPDCWSDSAQTTDG